MTARLGLHIARVVLTISLMLLPNACGPEVTISTPIPIAGSSSATAGMSTSDVTIHPTPTTVIAPTERSSAITLPAPTRTPLSPTHTLLPSTDTPTNTPTYTPPPTNTSLPPTKTPNPPTATPVPPTNTSVPPTDPPASATASQCVLIDPAAYIVQDVDDDQEFFFELRQNGAGVDLRGCALEFVFQGGNGKHVQLWFKDCSWKTVMAHPQTIVNGQAIRFDPATEPRRIDEFNDFNCIFAIGAKVYGGVQGIQIAEVRLQ
jgi:hypothetical protein